MKRENLTREQAIREAVNGKVLTHDDVPNSNYVFDKEKARFKMINCLGEVFDTTLDFKDGYYIIEPEPKYKEVVMYAPVIQARDCDMPRISILLDAERDGAMKRVGAIGYTEVKVFLKDEQ